MLYINDEMHGPALCLENSVFAINDAMFLKAFFFFIIIIITITIIVSERLGGTM